jgi:hypothetical protein
MDNLTLWNKVKQPPASVLKQIGGGRLKGMTDISPAWRYQTLTEHFGICGIGWKYTIDELWTVPGADGEHFAFARISLFTRNGKDWSDAIPGIGGGMLIEKQKDYMYNNDEAYKMAVTDALSVACKMLGLASDVYMGLWDGSKYRVTPPTAAAGATGASRPTGTAPAPSKPVGSAPSTLKEPVKTTAAVNQELKKPGMTDAQREKAGLIVSKYINELMAQLEKTGISPEKWKLWLETVYGYPNIYAIMIDAYPGILKAVKDHPEVIKDFDPDSRMPQGDNADEPLPF